jgi:hypothetical protein
MDSDRLNRWLTLIANFGVVVGLILLVVEIRQNTDFIKQESIVARGNFGGGSFDDTGDVHKALIDADLSLIFEKAVEGTEPLSIEETIRLSHFLASVVTMLYKDGYGAEIGIYEHSPRLVERIVPQFFGNSFARSWWNASKSRYPYALTEVIDRVIAETPVDANKKYYESIRSSR